MDKKTSLGLSENLTGALAYVGMFITGIIVFIAEKENKFVRFCALQSFVFFLAWVIVVSIVSWFGGIPIIGFIVRIISRIISTAGFIAWAYLTITAFMGKTVKIPILGEAVWEQVNK